MSNSGSLREKTKTAVSLEAEALGGAGAGEILQHLAHGSPVRAGDVVELSTGRSPPQLLEELAREIGGRRVVPRVARPAVALLGCQPVFHQGLLVFLDERGDRGVAVRHKVLTWLQRLTTTGPKRVPAELRQYRGMRPRTL